MTKFPDDVGAKNSDHWSIRLDPDLKKEIRALVPVMKDEHKKDLIEAIRVKIREVVNDARTFIEQAS